MPLPPAVALSRSDGDRQTLAQVSRHRSTPQSIVLRAKIVLVPVRFIQKRSSKWRERAGSQQSESGNSGVFGERTSIIGCDQRYTVTAMRTAHVWRIKNEACTLSVRQFAVDKGSSARRMDVPFLQAWSRWEAQLQAHSGRTKAQYPTETAALRAAEALRFSVNTGKPAAGPVLFDIVIERYRREQLPTRFSTRVSYSSRDCFSPTELAFSGDVPVQW